MLESISQDASRWSNATRVSSAPLKATHLSLYLPIGGFEHQLSRWVVLPNQARMGCDPNKLKGMALFRSQLSLHYVLSEDRFPRLRVLSDTFHISPLARSVQRIPAILISFVGKDTNGSYERPQIRALTSFDHNEHRIRFWLR